MRLELARDYLTIPEVIDRWHLAPASTDLHWAVMKRVVRPCIWIRGVYDEVRVQEDGRVLPFTENEKPVARNVNAWCYPLFQQQVGSYELVYPIVCDESGDAPRLLALPQPLTLSDLLAQGVVMMADVEQAEEQLAIRKPEDVLHGKERITLYKLLVSLMVQAYGWDPEDARSSAVADLVRDAEEIGISVSFNSAKEHLRKAWAKCPPKVAA